MKYENEDLTLIDGGRGRQSELPCHDDSPTWIVDQAWDYVKDICKNSLAAYMDYCKEENLPHSFLLGLDVLIMCEVDPENPYRLCDIRPTLVEGPCCNSYPACPNLDSYKLYRRLQAKGFQPDEVEYPTHPTQIRQKIAKVFADLWHAKGGSGMPRVGIFTRPYPESEEEAAHVAMEEGFKDFGLKVYRVTPDENPYVKDGKLWIGDVPLDFCYRRIERIHVPMFYGEEKADQIINHTPETIFINPWKIDDLRSKTIEEKVFRRYEAAGKGKISRPITLLGDEISSESVARLASFGGYVVKKWNSTGGKGVFLNLAEKYAAKACDFLYLKYDGRHMDLLDDHRLEKELKEFDDFTEDTAIQQLRLTDARVLNDRERLVYDTRINWLYDPAAREWNFLSGFSRSVPCGPDVESGNSLLTNITSGAEISPLVIGYVKNKKFLEKLNFGPLLDALMKNKTELKIK